MNPNDLFPELKDIRPPVDAPQAPWLWIAVAVCAALLIIAAVIIIVKKRKFAPKNILSPAEESLAALDKIRLEDLHRTAEAAAFYVALSDILRRFLERQFGIHAPEMTTEEFLQSLKDHQKLSDKQKTMMEDFLRRCDLVKFARQDPDSVEARRNFEAVKDFIKETTSG